MKTVLYSVLISIVIFTSYTAYEVKLYHGSEQQSEGQYREIGAIQYIKSPDENNKQVDTLLNIDALSNTAPKEISNTVKKIETIPSDTYLNLNIQAKTNNTTTAAAPLLAADIHDTAYVKSHTKLSPVDIELAVLETLDISQQQQDTENSERSIGGFIALYEMSEENYENQEKLTAEEITQQVERTLEIVIDGKNAQDAISIGRFIPVEQEL